jgi:hypothetical protein
VSHNHVGDALHAQGDLAGALREYGAGLAIAERLAAADPGNAQWRRDLWIACWKVANLLELSGDPSATAHWRRALDTRSAVKQAGMYVFPGDEQFYQRLRDKLGG